jgi:hypothetical protein
MTKITTFYFNARNFMRLSLPIDKSTLNNQYTTMLQKEFYHDHCTYYISFLHYTVKKVVELLDVFSRNNFLM